MYKLLPKNNILLSFLCVGLLLSIVSNAQVLLLSSGSGGTYTLQYPANLGGTLPPGIMFTFKANHSVSGVGATLDLNGTGAKAIKKLYNQDVTVGDIAQNHFVTLIYDNTNDWWQMLSVQATPPAGTNFWTVSGTNLVPLNGSQNLALGTSQGSASLNITGKSDNLNSYALVITNSTNGINFVVRDDGFVGIGTTAPGYMLHVNGRVKSNGLNETSDIRLKTDIEKLTNVLEKVLQMQGVSYRMKDDNRNSMLDDSKSESKHRISNIEHRKEIGLIAQEVEVIYPELVHTDAQGFKSLEYSRVVALLIEAIKEQQKEINNQQSKIKNLETDVEGLKAEWKTVKEDLQRNYPTKSEK